MYHFDNNFRGGCVMESIYLFVCLFISVSVSVCVGEQNVKKRVRNCALRLLSIFFSLFCSDTKPRVL